MDSQDLLSAALDIERHVASQGWDQPALLFALVPTDLLRAEQLLARDKFRLEVQHRPLQTKCDICGLELPEVPRLGKDYEFWGEGIERVTLWWPCANEP